MAGCALNNLSWEIRLPTHGSAHSHRKMSTISSTSVLSFLTWSRLATVTIGTYWSLSIWEMRYMSLARFSLGQKEEEEEEEEVSPQLLCFYDNMCSLSDGGLLVLLLLL